ncbi:MAG: tetratricopeptide repeat protein [Acidobacteria bacterium]|nr:tetratricopeptide repeat protein [Acidobacteriota bacterium]
MGRFPDHRRRTRILIGLGLLALAAYLCLSFRFVRADGQCVIQDCRLTGGTPRILPAGWNFSPLGLCRRSSYPAVPQELPFNFPEPGTQSPVSLEGVASRVRGSLTYRIPPESALRLHKLTAEKPVADFLRPQLRQEIVKEVREASFARISGAHRVELEASLKIALGARLRGLGLTLLSVRVDSVRMALSGAAASTEPIPGSKLLVIGLDGADWRVIDPLLRRAQLPTLAKLIRDGVRARLKTVDPILSPVVWTTAATGFLPSEHGILDFLVRDQRTGKDVPVTSRHRKVKAVWNLLSDSGVSVGVIGWWATWPAEYVDGYIVSDRVGYQLFGQSFPADDSIGGRTFPPELYQKIRPLIQSPNRVDTPELKRYLRYSGPTGPLKSADFASRERELKTVLASTNTYEAISLALASNGFNSLEIIYFEGIDTVSHLFMPFRSPQRPGISDQDFAAYSEAVDAFYIRQDQILGEILAEADPNAGVVVLSDHGFKSENDRPQRESRINYSSAASWHRKYGIFIASGGRFRRGAALAEFSILDLTPTILAYFGLPVGEDMQGRPMIEVFQPEFLQEHPVTYRPSWETQAPPTVLESFEDPDGDRAIREKLLSLGYLSREGKLTSNNMGSALLAEGKVEAAIHEFENAVHEAPRLVLARINLARAYLANGDTPRARQEVKQALRLDADSPEATVLLAEIELSQKDDAAAEKRLRELVRQDPSMGSAHRLLGQIFLSRGEAQRAESEFLQALSIDPDDAQSQNWLGILLRESGKPEESESRFRRAIEADPSSFAALSNLATCAMERDDLAEAEKLMERAIAIAPDDPAVRNNRGNLFLRRGELDKAAAEFRRALELRPRYAEPHNGLGAVHSRRDEGRQAEAEFREAISLDPKSPEQRLNLARLHWSQGKKREAEQDLRKYLQAVPGEARASLELGGLLLDSGRARESADLCTASLQVHPDDYSLWNLRGESLWQLGSMDGAIDSFRRSLEVNPFQPEISARLQEASAGVSP